MKGEASVHSCGKTRFHRLYGRSVYWDDDAVGSPISTIIGLLDGNFMGVARQEDWAIVTTKWIGVIYTVAKKNMHGFKCLYVILGNCMECTKRPYSDSFHDSAMLNISLDGIRWIQKFLPYRQRIGIQLYFFADVRFPNEDHVVTMIKPHHHQGLSNSHWPDIQRTHGSNPQWFRILIEKAFAGQYQVFKFLSF